MPVSVRRLSRRFSRLCVLALGSGMLVPMPATAAEAPVINVGEPAGFAELAGRQTLLVDVYFGGVRRGEATIAATPDAVTISNPTALLDLLPRVADRAAVEAALATPSLPANAARACTEGADRTTCGRLTPEIAGVILDRDRLRMDVFLNPRFLAVQEYAGQQYLPAPLGGPSMINSIGAVLSGRSGAGGNYYNFQDQLVLSNGTGRLRAEFSYANGYGFESERLALELDRPGMRYSAGALWAPGNDLSGRQKVLGLGMETQIDTRLDKDELLGSPVVIYLEQRARVDVLRDGRVLNSAIYEAGNQQVDTANLPDGSYEIVLRIDEPGRPTREERRFFSKSRRVPSRGRTDFFAFGGMLVDDPDPGSLNPSRHSYVQGGVSHRLSESWALEGGLQTTDRNASAEVAAILITPIARVRAAAVVDLDGRYGGILQVISSGGSRFNFNVDLRHMESDAPKPDPVSQPTAVGGPLDAFAPVSLVPLGTSYTQAGGLISFSLANLRFLGIASYRDDRGEPASYSIGPSLEWDVLRKGPLTLTMRGEMAATAHGTSEFAGISLRFIGGRSSVTALAGARSSAIQNDGIGGGSVGALAGSWTADVVGGDLAVGAGYEHQPRQDSLVLTSEFHDPLGSLSGDFVRSDGGGGPVSQYSLGLQTTLAVGAGGVRVAGRTTTEGMIVAQVDGARDGDRFDIMVNEQFAGTIVGNRPLTLTLPTYRAYNVRIRPTGKDLLAYDSSSRSIALYPGAVTRLEWKVAPVTIRFGRLVGPEGIPVRHASITGKGVWAETDENGMFQIEAPDDADLTVTTSDGRSFATILPKGHPFDGIARLGAVICCVAPAVRLGALDPIPTPSEGGHR